YTTGQDQQAYIYLWYWEHYISRQVSRILNPQRES
ncbi:hypothetical protein A2U01_0062050, partial [Trifolium medium]|nr:hypothetical protein [Trifolium medium]